MYVHTHIHTSPVCGCVCTYTYKREYRVLQHICVCMCTQICVCAHTHTHTTWCMCVYVHTHTNINTVCSNSLRDESIVWARRKHERNMSKASTCVYLIYSQSHLEWHFPMLFQSAKLKSRTSLFTETLQKRRSNFELWAFENVTPNGIGCTSCNTIDTCRRYHKHMSKATRIYVLRWTCVYRRTRTLQDVYTIDTCRRRLARNTCVLLRLCTCPHIYIQTHKYVSTFIYLYIYI